MAFNPFHAFRKNSKVVFAGLTILCMVTFILSSGMGKGDFFSQVSEAFGGRTGPTLATVYGKSYSARDIDQINNQRRVANDYMDAAIAASRQVLEDRLMKSAEQLPPDVRGQFSQTLQMRYFYLRLGYAQMIPEMYRQAEFQSRVANEAKKPDVANAWGGLTSLLTLDNMLLANRAPGEKFFGMTERDKLDDTVNFLVWRHQADQMGIRLTDSDIGRMIEEETLGELNDRAGEMVDRMMRERFSRTGFSVEALYAALGDEFRARMAQVALTGTASGVGRHTLTAPPVELTPQESWSLFKNARTTVRLGLIDVPVKDFLAQVTATPSEEELKKLFDKYKTDEPAPDRELPGFKEPRKIKVEWVGAGPDLPFYQKAADEVLAVAPALRLLANTDPVLTLMAPTQLDAEYIAPQQAYQKQESKWWEDFEPPTLPRLHESSAVRADTVTSLIGTTLGSVSLGVPAILNGPLAMQATGLKQELEARAKFGVSMIGLGIAPTPMGVFAAPFAALPKISGEGRSQLRTKIKTELLSGGRDGGANKPAGLVASDLYTFRGEVMKLYREKGKDAAEKYIGDFVKERGIEHGMTAEPRDQYHLGDDPGLAPLKEAYRKANGTRDLLLRQFGPEFFVDKTQEADAPDGPFIPHKYVVTGQPDEKQFYWWRTEDIPPRTPKYEKAKAEVVEAWKTMRARELAKKEADRLLDAIKKSPREAANLRDIAAQNGNREYFELGPIALWMARLTQTPGGGFGRTYESVAQQPPLTPDALAQLYNIPPDRIAYPDAEMISHLLDLREDPKGATTIVADKPRRNYFVATLLQRDEPSPDEFRLVYRGSMMRAPESDRLLAYLNRGRAEEYRKAVVQQLRAEGKVEINESGRQPTSNEQ